MTTSTTTTRKLVRSGEHRPAAEPGEPPAGLWGYRLGQAVVLALLLTVVPCALAVGLGWTTWDRLEALTPALRRLAAVIWGVSLLGLALSVAGLSGFGPKRRTLLGLLLHTLIILGPIIAALVA